MFHMLLGVKGMNKLSRQVNGNQPIPEEMPEYQELIEKGRSVDKNIEYIKHS